MGNFLVTKEVEFDAGHRVPNHESKCRNPHGHRYRVRICVIGKLVDKSGASDEGMVIDFGNLKALLVEYVHDPLDHGFIVYEGDQQLLECFEGTHLYEWKVIEFPYIPTAERI